MALREVTNTCNGYVAQIRLADEYAPLVRRGKNLGTQASRSSFRERRQADGTNIDLWIDGQLYPTDPSTERPPPFSTVKEYLEFVCKGENGMLGYTKRLRTDENRCRGGESGDQELRLRCQVETLQSMCAELRTSVMQCKQSSIREEIENRQKLEAVDGEFRRCRDELENLKEKMRSMVETPEGFRQRATERKLKTLDELASRSGNAKRRRAMLKAYLQPSFLKRVQQRNKQRRGTDRLAEDSSAQSRTAACIASILSSREAAALVEQPRMSQATTAVTNGVLTEIGKTVGANTMLDTCDVAGLTQRAYVAVYKTLKHQIRLVAPGMSFSILPAPHRLATLRREMNAKLPLFIGEYYHVDGCRSIPEVKVGKKVVSPAKEVILEKKNNIFVDLEVVQQSMVMFYGMTVEECNGGALVFVLKLDEAKILQGKKFERVSLTLMNRALDPNIQKDNERYFSVQSEQEIWPIGCFQVGKESHDILNWVFQQTPYREVMDRQNKGELLVVPGVGSFTVEWHLSADMKTIKCMFGLHHGPSSAMTCIYCEQIHERVRTCSAAEAQREARLRGKGTWQGGLFAPRISAEPCDTSTHPRWKPVLPIPLSRTHICTLHALVRVVEKVLHMHFMFVWNIQDVGMRSRAIDAIEKSLSAIGVEGGNCQLKKDDKLSGKSGNVVAKPSLSGAVAARLFRSSPWSTNDRVWKDVCMSEQNQLEGGQSRLKRWALWEALQAVLPYLTGLVLAPELQATCRMKMDAFGKAFVAAFGETHVTHYIHVLVKHGPWFVERYGSLSVWSCQGLEKSHHAAKAATQAHTQHGGTTGRTSIIVQQYQHWYRNIQHRYARRAATASAATGALEPDVEAVGTAARRREAWHASSARGAHQSWRDGRRRDGRRWSTPDENVQLSNDAVDLGGIHNGYWNAAAEIVGGTFDEVYQTGCSESMQADDSCSADDADVLDEQVIDITLV